MTYVREEVRGTTGQDIMKFNENFMNIFEKVFGDINFSDTDTALQNSILTQYIPFQGDGNVDKTYPLYVRFYVPPNIKTIKGATLNAFVENYRKMSNYIYLRVKGQGKLKLKLKTERKTKELIIDLPEEETLLRKKLKNKGRMFQLMIENVDNSSFELVAPELICELDAD